MGCIYPDTLGVHKSGATELFRLATDTCRIIPRYLNNMWKPTTHVMKISSTVLLYEVCDI